MRPSRRTLVLAAAGLAAYLTLTGCSTTSSTTGDRPDELPRDVPAGTGLVVADQSEQLQVSLAASGEAAKLAADVSYANFTGGPAILEAFRAGAADLATVGDTPPIQAQAAGEDVQIVAAKRVDANATRLAVAAGADIGTLADLEGRKIAYAEGTAQQATVLRALAKAGLQTSDVELVRLQLGDFPDAVRTGQVDVAVLGEPNLTRFLSETPGGSVIPVEESDGTSTGLSYLYARGEALDDPATSAAIADYVTHWIAAGRWINDNPDAWVQAYYVDNQAIPAEDGRRIVETAGENTFPLLDDKLVAVQQNTIDTITEAGELPVDDLDADDSFDLRFAAVQAEAITAAGATETPVEAT